MIQTVQKSVVIRFGNYFDIKETPVRGISLSYKQIAINVARERYGFFTLISNEVKDPVIAIRLYRMSDIVEKAFWNIKRKPQSQKSSYFIRKFA